MLVIVCGLPSTGKSTVSKRIAADSGGKILRTDIIRRELFKEATLDEVLGSDDPLDYNLEKVFDAQDAIPDKYQEMIWQQKKLVYEELFQRIRKMLIEDTTVVLDGTFYERSLRERIYTIAKAASTSVYIVECTCPEEVVKARLEKRRLKADDASFADKMHVYLRVKAVYESPLLDSAKYSVPLVVYDTDLRKFEVYNPKAGNRGLDLIIGFIKKLIDGSS